jgi:cysteine desulfurase / selenocysteine lyase
MIYFDQAASSFPKPTQVAKAMAEAVNEYGANPGRGGHALARKAAEKIFEARTEIATLFGLRNPKRVLFFQNATGALNQAIQGFPLEQGDHVITTSFEHNSVRRPLEHIRKTKGVNVTFLKMSKKDSQFLDQLKSTITNRTKLIVVTHASNLTGTIMPIKEIAQIASSSKIKLLVDASQTAGVLPIHMEELGVDMIAFPGHKGLLGPQGTGALLVREGIDLIPINFGGTGQFSESADQPLQWPERFESGTLNTPGIAGLLEGIKEIKRIGLQSIYRHEQELTTYCLHKLREVDGLTIIESDLSTNRLAVISFVIDGVDSQEAAVVFDQHYHIALRAGLHCSPLAHMALGTIQTGALRISFGPYTKREEGLKHSLYFVYK